MDSEIPITAVGAHLVGVARDWERSPGEILTELYPYVFEASKRMSTREISRWLDETHGIKMSQPTVSRALRNPDKYWQTFAELMEPHARTIERAVPVTMGQFMKDSTLFEWALHQTLSVEGNNQNEVEECFHEVDAAADYLRNHWFCLSPLTRSYMTHFFDDDEAKDTETPEKQEETK